MARRYVPRTYNNRRFFRIIATGIITIALAFLILFLTLFFILQAYVVDGQLQIPWLSEEEIYPDRARETEVDEGEEFTEQEEQSEPEDEDEQ